MSLWLAKFDFPWNFEAQSLESFSKPWRAMSFLRHAGGNEMRRGSASMNRCSIAVDNRRGFKQDELFWNVQHGSEPLQR